MSTRGIGGRGSTKRLAKKRAKALGEWQLYAAIRVELLEARRYVLIPVGIDEATREYNALLQAHKAELLRCIAIAEKQWG